MRKTSATSTSEEADESLRKSSSAASKGAKWQEAKSRPLRQRLEPRQTLLSCGQKCNKPMERALEDVKRQGALLAMRRSDREGVGGYSSNGGGGGER